MIEIRPEEEIAKYFGIQTEIKEIFKLVCVPPKSQNWNHFYLRIVWQLMTSLKWKRLPMTGQWFVLCCNWKKNEPFEIIFEVYANLLQFLQISTVVFDGYSLSTKDTTQKKCSGKTSATIERKEANLCVTNWNTFSVELWKWKS